ncbi:hypothetical protein ACZ75_06600 [Massilia sp. NR 4-1]|nr:hypothetical protein ACZ75_06600 [Massilia sp. NR 4-1]
MKAVEALCWVFFGACVLGISRWLILYALGALGWGTPDWAAWVQAVGSIAAIVGAFLISHQQHMKAQAAEKARQKAEQKKAEDTELHARTLAAKNVVQVGSHAMEMLRGLVDSRQVDKPAWETEKYEARADQLRSILDACVAPGTDHVTAVAALAISHAITMILADMKNVGGAMTQEITMRCDQRVEDAHAFLCRLINLSAMLIAKCKARGIPLESDEFE